MKLPRKLYLSVVGLLLLAFVAFGYLNINKTNPSETIQESPVEFKDVKSSELNPEELEEYYAVYKNPFVLYLREVLNAYLANDISRVDISTKAVKENRQEGIIHGLDAFDKGYYGSKFVVVSFNKNLAGGADIFIAFQDKPDKIFYAWVYPLTYGNYELREFYFNEKDFDIKAIEGFKRKSEQFLLDEEHAL